MAEDPPGGNRAIQAAGLGFRLRPHPRGERRQPGNRPILSNRLEDSTSIRLVLRSGTPEFDPENRTYPGEQRRRHRPRVCWRGVGSTDQGRSGGAGVATPFENRPAHPSTHHSCRLSRSAVTGGDRPKRRRVRLDGCLTTPPAFLFPPPLLDLCLRSMSLYPALVEELGDTGFS